MSKIKYIFIDVDGTIVDNENRIIPQSTKDTIRHLLKTGHKLFIASGRAKRIIVTGVDDEFSGYICSLGTNIYYENKEIYDGPYTKEEIEFIRLKANELGINLSFECKNKGYIHENNDVDDYNFNDEYGPNGNDYWHGKNYNGEPVYKMMVDTDVKNQNNFDLFNEAVSDMALGCVIKDKNKCVEELCRKNHSKGDAIKMLVNLGICKIEDTIAIGDSSNDISMLEVANIGIVMGQAEDYIKEKADIITDSVDSEGFYKAFKKLGLID